MHVRMFDLRVKNSKIRKDLKKIFENILDHGMFFFGPELEEFEKKISVSLNIFENLMYIRNPIHSFIYSYTDKSKKIK